ncbi:BlaI/MecI/CopY family transcriptional regulator [Dactylosporangium sp. AC04546]|uniref:BlaI/MecI/CopY family transcriptional regulator n=1 Tax=Dactylosporangium sp. AC04546 TaxID=2862460 RepID=UPI001EDF3081|nr:BlaI/MecI/CopY family transcriptional regulator [Dactylosporangium sp. AC04546]WVK88944.1 BlaI/MecI/CopY family transcriptional regulator [Dactylosporangium sp. AC04546]
MGAPRSTADDGSGGGRRRSGQLEAQIVTVLGEATGPLTPGEVRDRLEPHIVLSYSTVVTTLSRLYEKGVVARHREGRAFRYSPLSDAAGLVADRMNKLLAVEADHASVLRRFINKLDDRDEQLLRNLLNEDHRR